MSSSFSPPPEVDLSSLSSQKYDWIVPEEGQLRRGDLVLVNSLVFAELPGEEELVSVYDLSLIHILAPRRQMPMRPKLERLLSKLPASADL